MNNNVIRDVLVPNIQYRTDTILALITVITQLSLFLSLSFLLFFLFKFIHENPWDAFHLQLDPLQQASFLHTQQIYKLQPLLRQTHCTGLYLLLVLKRQDMVSETTKLIRCIPECNYQRIFGALDRKSN